MSTANTKADPGESLKGDIRRGKELSRGMEINSQLAHLGW